MEEKSRSRVVDQPAEQLARLLSTENWETRSAKYVDLLIQRAHRSTGFSTEELSGESAAVYLERLIGAVTEELIDRAQGYSAARWLWYLRRLPDSLFSGTYRTTIGYDRTLAESISWYSTKMEGSNSDKYYAFRVDGSACRHLTNFVAGVRLLSHLHSIYRRVGKGASVFFRGVFPFAIQGDGVARAIEIYDERLDHLQDISFSSLGLSGKPWSLKDNDALPEEHASTLYLFSPCEPIRVPVKTPLTDGGTVHADVLARHIFARIPVDSFLKPYSEKSTEELPFIEAIEPIIVFQMMIPILINELPAALSNILQFGYCVVHPSRFEKLFAVWLPPLVDHLSDIAPSVKWSSSYEEWRNRCRTTVPKLWPLQSGGLIRESENAVILDLTASSRTLINRTTIERTAFGFSKIRADKFERQVQAIVDNSEWRPNARLGAMRGRTLRRDEKALTDIDAIGSRNGTLLLISCKSVIYDGEYDKGTYRVVVNVQATVDDAIAKWLKIIADIKESPVGDNFDFSGFTEIIGVVCTPFIVYSDKDITLDQAMPGLRRCVAAHELRGWLKDEKLESA